MTYLVSAPDQIIHAHGISAKSHLQYGDAGRILNAPKPSILPSPFPSFLSHASFCYSSSLRIFSYLWQPHQERCEEYRRSRKRRRRKRRGVMFTGGWFEIEPKGTKKKVKEGAKQEYNYIAIMQRVPALNASSLVSVPSIDLILPQILFILALYFCCRVPSQ